MLWQTVQFLVHGGTRMIVDSCVAVPAASSMWTVQRRRIGRGSDGVGTCVNVVGTYTFLGSPQLTSPQLVKRSESWQCCTNKYVCYVWCVSGMECKLRELCDDLLGPVHAGVHSSSHSNWNRSVLVCYTQSADSQCHALVLVKLELVTIQTILIVNFSKINE